MRTVEMGMGTRAGTPTDRSEPVPTAPSRREWTRDDQTNRTTRPRDAPNPRARDPGGGTSSLSRRRHPRPGPGTRGSEARDRTTQAKLRLRGTSTPGTEQPSRVPADAPRTIPHGDLEVGHRDTARSGDANDRNRQDPMMGEVSVQRRRMTPDRCWRLALKAVPPEGLTADGLKCRRLHLGMDATEALRTPVLRLARASAPRRLLTRRRASTAPGPARPWRRGRCHPCSPVPRPACLVDG